MLLCGGVFIIGALKVDKGALGMRTACRNRSIPCRTFGRREGAASLEFAMVLPLLLLMMFGAIDFGRFAHSFIAVTNSSRAGAGFASIHPTTNASLAGWQSDVRATVLAELSQTLQSTGLVANDVTISVPAPTTVGNGAATRKSVTVTVTIPFRSIVSWPLLPQNVTLTRTTVFRAIR